MLRFAAVADLQYGDMDDTIGRNYRGSIEKFLLAAGEIAAANLPFTINFGDSWQKDWKNALAVAELFEIAEKHAGIKWKHILGNHDFGVTDAEKPQIYSLLHLEKPGYYDFPFVDSDDPDNRWRIIVLNGNEISLYAAENDEERAAAKQEREKRRIAENDDKLPATYNGSLSATQLKWLDDKLKETDASGENALVCSHFPLYAKSGSIGAVGRLVNFEGLDVFFYLLGVTTWNGRELLDVLDRHSSVRGYFAGHLHEGAYGVRRNVAHVTFKGVVETPKNCFAFVELKKDRIVVDGRCAQPSYEHIFKS